MFVDCEVIRSIKSFYGASSKGMPFSLSSLPGDMKGSGKTIGNF